MVWNKTMVAMSSSQSREIVIIAIMNAPLSIDPEKQEW
jgi:hypothetical protein